MAAPPGIGFLASHPAHAIALGLGSGLSPVAPGTVGTLFGWLSFDVLGPLFSEVGLFAFLAAGFAVGALACQRTGKDLGVPDHGAIVIDEIVAFWLVLAFAPHGFGWQLAAFLLFRAFDIAKPPPAHWVDSRMKHGFGVMLDDLIAAAYAIFALALLKRLVG